MVNQPYLLHYVIGNKKEKNKGSKKACGRGRYSLRALTVDPTVQENTCGGFQQCGLSHYRMICPQFAHADFQSGSLNNAPKFLKSYNTISKISIYNIIFLFLVRYFIIGL